MQSLIKSSAWPMCVLWALSQAVQASEVLEYRVGLEADGATYTVYMTPGLTPDPDVNLTGQVTLVVPHGDGDERFQMAQLNSALNGLRWTVSSRVDAPVENPYYDYISVSFRAGEETAGAGYWEAGEELAVLSFRNPGVCLGAVALMERDDVFNQLPNSAHTNPGNQFTNLGWGETSENHYWGNYGGSVDCRFY